MATKPTGGKTHLYSEWNLFYPYFVDVVVLLILLLLLLLFTSRSVYFVAAIFSVVIVVVEYCNVCYFLFVFPFCCVYFQLLESTFISFVYSLASCVFLLFIIFHILAPSCFCWYFFFSVAVVFQVIILYVKLTFSLWNKFVCFPLPLTRSHWFHFVCCC